MSQERDQRFDALWRRRATLNQAEWIELWTIVQQVLTQGFFNGLYSLPDEPEVYIADFFHDKVFEPGLSATAESSVYHHTGLLRVAFERYLLDRIRAQKRRGLVSLSADEEEDEKPAEAPPLAAVAGQSSVVGAAHAPHAPGAPLDNRPLPRGLDEAAIRAAARDWLARQPDWVTLYLGLHHCPCAEDQMPLSRLAERYRIPSHHPRAQKLGITHRKSDLGKPWFRKTLLGQWLERDLGLPIDAEHAEALGLALKLLCGVAMRQVRALQNPAPAGVDRGDGER